MDSGQTETFDVVISGGGMVGMSLALALGRAGARVGVVDALDPATATHAGFDGRVSAVAFASCRMLEAIGAWPHLGAHAQPINDILVTDGRVGEGASSLFLHFDHREIGDAPLGNLIENRHIRLGLMAALEDTPEVRLFAPVTVTGMEALPAGARVALSDGTHLEAKAIVAAEGRRSNLREAAGIKLVQWSYDQIGIVATVEHERPHNGIAQEYFLPSGPFAILPMTGNRSSLVWTERPATAKALLTSSDDVFAAECAKRFGSYLGEARPVGPRWSYPLSLQIARRYIAPRLALVGDTAHGIHPIAGQGLNLGLRDVAALAEVMTDARRLGLDLGAEDILRKYETWRRFDNTMLALVMDGLNRLFSNDIGPLRLARDLGLGLVNRIGPARRLFMRHAGGAVSLTPESLPRLLAGQAL